MYCARNATQTTVSNCGASGHFELNSGRIEGRGRPVRSALCSIMCSHKDSMFASYRAEKSSSRLHDTLYGSVGWERVGPPCAQPLKVLLLFGSVFWFWCGMTVLNNKLDFLVGFLPSKQSHFYCVSKGVCQVSLQKEEKTKRKCIYYYYFNYFMIRTNHVRVDFHSALKWKCESMPCLARWDMMALDETLSLR